MPSVRFNDNDVELVVLGGGPGGLALITQVLEGKENAKVVVYERFEEYQRHHVLKLERKSFRFFPDTKRIQNVINDFFKGKELPGPLKIFSSFLNKEANVKTSTIEGNFKKLALSQNIEIRYETIDDPEELAARHPNAKFIAAADGSKSETRKRIFTQKMYLHENELELILTALQTKQSSLTLDDLKKLCESYKVDIKKEKLENTEATETLLKDVIARHDKKGFDALTKIVLQRLAHEVVPHQKDLQYIAELKYEVKGEATPLKKVPEAYYTEQTLETVVHEHIGRTHDGVTPITVRVFIDKETFEALQHKATFKKPLTLNDEAVPEHVRKKFTSWLRVRGLGLPSSPLSIFSQAHEDPKLRQKEKLTVTRLQTYYSDEVVKEHNGRTYVILSDAAAGVPFFRSYNDLGLIDSSFLAQDIVAALKPPRHSIIDEIGSWFFKKEIVKKPEPAKPLARYAANHAKRVRDAIAAAEFKNSALNAYKVWLESSHRAKVSIKESVSKTQIGKDLFESVLKGYGASDIDLGTSRLVPATA